MVSDPLANPVLSLLDGTCRNFRIGIHRKADLEGNERIDDLMSHGIHKSLTSLGFPLGIISNFRPSRSQHCGLETSIEELIHVEGPTVEFEERLITMGEINGEQREEPG